MTRDAEKFDYLRKQMLRLIAHEVRASSGVVWGALNELEEIMAEGPASEKLMLIARRSTKRLTRLADRLSMTAELEQGPLVLQRAGVDLSVLVTTAMQEAAEIAGRKGLDVEIDSASLSVDAEERWLAGTFLELAVNAFRNARTRVRARVRRAEGKVQVLFEDDGLGLPEDVRPDAERFVPAGPVSGLGLSLPMAKDVAHAHGGRLVIEKSTLPSRGSDMPGAAIGLELPIGPCSRDVESVS